MIIKIKKDKQIPLYKNTYKKEFEWLKKKEAMITDTPDVLKTNDGELILWLPNE